MAGQGDVEAHAVHHFLNWDFPALRVADEEMFDDGGSELSDIRSWPDSMDIDLDPFQNEPKLFVAQYVPLPLEVIEMIVIHIDSDADLLNFVLACKDFAFAILPEGSTVWRTRFLNYYDHPIIQDPGEFRIAYQLREMVLRKFPSFADGAGARGQAALEVLRDMVLETYHRPRQPQYACSRNLALLSSPEKASYMTKFFSSPFFAHETARYGKPNSLFESLQVLFSHLVLHPCCEFAITMPVSRGDYDLSIVYLFEKGLETIYQRGASSLAHPGHQQMLLKLDLNALLHIRNFWHSHLVQRQTEKYADAVQTYGEMARSLVKRDHAPRGWNRPIQESLGLLPSWFGHYSCTHPAPKKLIDIEEHQSCAEDWVNQFGTNGVHPLTLNMTTTSSPARGWWPPIFSSVPILESTTPEAKPGSGHLYLRGIAPFLSPLKHPDMYPAYTALRIRGVIHTLPDQEEIPGWRRIVMVLYKPTSRYLLSVLDENSPDEEDDNPFDQIDQLATLLQPAQSVGQDPGQAQASAQDSAQVQVQTQTQAEPTAQEQPQILPADAEAEEKIMKEQLEARDELKGPVGPVYLTRDFIAEMEDKLHPPEELAWEDINYAYVYEGVIIPGGMIMMGRYWRFGPPTAAIGFEQGEGADRGPFVFWC